ncbi:hypothetical protein OG21DRAFT_915803 [Imleria badia]|nr:hypothetical protein OG21DRAFT_915803 [Imleria badia]
MCARFIEVMFEVEAWARTCELSMTSKSLCNFFLEVVELDSHFLRLTPRLFELVFEGLDPGLGALELLTVSLMCLVEFPQRHGPSAEAQCWCWTRAIWDCWSTMERMVDRSASHDAMAEASCATKPGMGFTYALGSLKVARCRKRRGSVAGLHKHCATPAFRVEAPFLPALRDVLRRGGGLAMGWAWTRTRWAVVV